MKALAEWTREFDADPGSDRAERILRHCLEHSQPVPRAVLTWALSLPTWDAIPDGLAELAARAVSTTVATPARFVGLERFSLGDQQHRVAVFDVGGEPFALIPGGEVELGWDRHTLPAELEQAWAQTPEPLGGDHLVEQVLGGGSERPTPPSQMRQWLDTVLSPLRRVHLDPFLIEMAAHQRVDVPSEGDDPHASIAFASIADGLRLPTPDEWEHACAAGSRGLFRWGDVWPIDSHPYDGGPFELHTAPNAFGLRITSDPYAPEVTSDPAQLRGGDGGEIVCGGAGFTAWVTYASSYVCDLGGLDYRDIVFESVLVRRALSVFPSEEDHVVLAYEPPDPLENAREAERLLSSTLEDFPGLLLDEAGKQELWRRLPIVSALRRRYPSDARIQLLCAIALRKLERLDEAIAAAKRAHELEPNWGTLTTLAVIHRVQGHVEQAARRFEQAFRLDPGDISPLVEMGDTFREGGRLVEALATYERVLELLPDHEWAFPAACFCRYQIELDARWRDELAAFVARYPTNEWAAAVLQALSE